MRTFIFILAFMAIAMTGAEANSQSFSVWLQALRAEAQSRGISQRVIDEALPTTLQPLPRVLELDQKQPESTKTFDEYLTDTVNPKRVRDGQTEMTGHHTVLHNIGEAYGVQPEVIVALWGVETSYGKNTGGFDVIPALATLAYDGRRSAFFRDELFKALQIADADHIPVSEMRGSWAGAMGQCQFMPSSFLKFAQDYNRDGKPDIWETESDVFASAANYLMQSGWRKGLPWGHRVIVPDDVDRSLLGLDSTQTIQFWHDHGVRLPDGNSVPYEGVFSGSVIQPDGPGTPAFIVYDNYRVILKWNKSKYFATSVGVLSDRLKGW